MNSAALGKALIIAGIALTLAGLFFLYGGKLTFFGLGRLPGDIRVERENFHFYFPITTSILISVILSLILYVLSRLR